MKRIVGILLLIGALAPLAAQESTDFIYFGDSRPELPGPQGQDSRYSTNPAQAGRTVHNGVSYAFIMLPRPGEISTGLFYSVTVPNFTLVNIVQETEVLDAALTERSATKELLGFQFGISSEDVLGPGEVDVSVGTGLYRTKHEMNDELATVNLDLGLVVEILPLTLELVARDLWVSHYDAGRLWGSETLLIASVGGRLILDITYALSVGWGPGYEDIYDQANFSVGLQIIRSFFANSLQTGVELGVFVDPDSQTNQLPLVKYGLAVSYTLDRAVTLIGEGGRTAALEEASTTARSLLKNLALEAAVLMVVSSYPDRESVRPIISIGATKRF
jgi:hypothetical protein